MDYNYDVDYAYRPTWTTTTGPVGITGNGFTINSDGTFTINTNINGNPKIINETSKSKIIIDKEEITGDDLKFIHALKDSFKHSGITTENYYTAIAKLIKNFNNPIEGENMKNMENVYFGPCGDHVKISHLGIAVKNLDNSWVSYDKTNDEIVNVDLLSFGDGNYVYMIPVALKDILVGDAIIHSGHVVFVKAVRNNKLRVIDVTDGEEKKIVPSKSIFGFDFVTKVISLIDFSSMTANEDNPFGNMLPFLLANKNTNEKDNNIFLLAWMLMNEKTQPFSSFSSTQLAFMTMMNQNKDFNILPLMFLMNQNIK